MASVTDLVSSQLGPEGIQAISDRLGIDPATAQRAVAGALPLLTGALARNAAQPEGAAALHNAVSRDHDGSLLDQAAGFLGMGDTGPGAAILGHIFGGSTPRASAGLGQATGLDAGKAGQLLAMLAPLVLSALGRMNRQKGLDSGGLADVLGSAQAQSGSGIGGMLTRILDRDGDGNAMDEIADMGGDLLGGLFGKR